MRRRSVGVGPARSNRDEAAGRFVTIEGIEGSGKSTLVAQVVAELRARGQTVVTTREPGGTPLGNRLRAAFVEPGIAIDPVAEAFVVNASRAQHVREVIEPALGAGAWVVCDRYTDATLAYQGFGRGLDLRALRTLAAIATGGRVPDLTLLVDVPVATSRARVATRSRASGVAIDRLEREDDAFHARVRAGYLDLARDDEGRFVVLNGSLPPEDVGRAALAALESKFSL